MMIKINELLVLRKEFLKMLYEESKGERCVDVSIFKVNARLKLSDEALKLVVSSLKSNGLICTGDNVEMVSLSTSGKKQVETAAA